MKGICIMKHLVIAEKPSVARDIARVLHCNKKTNTYIEGTEYIVTWALGHLVTLADPEEYGKEYQSWDLETLPMLPKDWKLVVIKQTGRQFHAVKEQIFRKDVSDIIIATDAGREGELVARWILEKAGNKKPLKRLWISSRISLSKNSARIPVLQCFLLHFPLCLFHNLTFCQFPCCDPCNFEFCRIFVQRICGIHKDAIFMK